MLPGLCPHYREAALGAFLLSEKLANRIKCPDFAYKDVLEAFDVFIKKHNQGRPFLSGRPQSGNSSRDEAYKGQNRRKAASG